MNITFLIGNGFDLNLGLNTKYTDFLKVYQPSALDKFNIIRFKNNIMSDLPLWSDAESAFGEYTVKFDNAIDFCDCHLDFCMKLAEYLNKQESRLSLEPLKDIIPKLFIDSIQSYLSGFREAHLQPIQAIRDITTGGYKYNFINFNYTRTLDKCIELVKNTGFLGSRIHDGTVFDNSIDTVLHIHGFTDKDMVLGVNDLSQIKQKSLFSKMPEEYIGQIIKRKTNQLNEEHMDEKCTDLLQLSHLIYIYGMSLGKTDAIWWERICEVLKNNSTAHVIIYAFSAPVQKPVRTKYLLYERQLKEKFIAYSNLSDEEKKSVINRIHVSTHNLFEPMKGLVNCKENQKKVLETV